MGVRKWSNWDRTKVIIQITTLISILFFLIAFYDPKKTEKDMSKKKRK